MLLIRMKKETSFEKQTASLIWPDKCNIVGVIAKANIERTMLVRNEARAVAEAQTGAQAAQSFNQTLLAASKDDSKFATSNGCCPNGAGRQKLDSGGAGDSASAGDGPVAHLQAHSHPTDLPLQAILSQVALLPSPDLFSKQVPFALPVDFPGTSPSSAGEASGDLAGECTSQNLVTNVRPSGFPGLTPNAVSNAVDNSTRNEGAVPAIHGPLIRPSNGPVAPGLTTVSASQDLSKKSAPDDGMSPTSASGTSDVEAGQFVAWKEQVGESVVASQGDAAKGNSEIAVKPVGSVAGGEKVGSKSSVGGLADLKQHVQPISSQAGPAASTQPSQTKGDQRQDVNSSQGPSAVLAPINLADHSVALIAHTQNSGNGPAPQSAAASALGTGPAPKATNNSASTPTTEPEVLPVINSSRLFQSIGQTEMRVGMRSNEFGNISINTSATRNLISAQISVDHGELAKAIAASLPDMQARLGGQQAMDVRVDVNGAGMGQGAGAFSGMPNGNSDQSRNGGQHEARLSSGHSSNRFAERQFAPVAAAMTTGEGWLNGRLDIRA